MDFDFPRKSLRVRGLKWKDLERGALITVPASSASAQDIRDIMGNRQWLVEKYSIQAY